MGALQFTHHGNKLKHLGCQVIAGDVRSLCREYTPEAVRKLATLMRHAESESVQVLCAQALLDRGWGKAPQAITGADGEGDVRVIIRHIVRGVTVEERPMIDVSPSEKLSQP